MKLKQLYMYILCLVLLCGCGGATPTINTQENQAQTSNQEVTQEVTQEAAQEIKQEGNQVVALSDIPAFSGQPYIAINNNVPSFTKADLTTKSFETYSELDELGRCGEAYANIGIDLMPTEKRGSIGSVKPTGWQTAKYDIVDGKYLYNRCHLIGYQLTAENANEKNLITGTRYLNVEGMLPFENMVADYIKETNNHVLYRVIPIYEADNLLAAGVQMEAMSVEDEGEGISFNVFVYNNQPGITLNYATGESSLGDSIAENSTAEDSKDINSEVSSEVSKDTNTEANKDIASKPSEDLPLQNDNNKSQATYILNTSTKKFHKSSCSTIKNMKEENKEEYVGTREEIIDKGYVACKKCNP